MQVSCHTYPYRKACCCFDHVSASRGDRGRATAGSRRPESQANVCSNMSVVWLGSRMQDEGVKAERRGSVLREARGRGSGL
jgi:hypothetical protein